MKPCSFDVDTCKEVIGDARMRSIESKAREDANAEIKILQDELRKAND